MALEDDNAPPQPQPQPLFISFDLISNILARLPVKSLLRFKCVCKECNSIISDTNFARFHLLRSTVDPAMNHQRLLLPTRDHGVMTCFVKSIFNDDPLITPQNCVDYTWTHHHDRYNILATCNGLVCLFRNEDEHKHVRFWNPSTRLVSKKSPFLNEVDDQNCLCRGFGYDPVSNRYKVVFVFPDYYFDHDSFRERIDYRTTYTHVYSSGDSSWKTLENKNYLGRTSNKEGKLVGNYLNWVTNKALDDRIEFEEWAVLCFDMRNEVFGLMSLPDFGDNKPPDPIQAVLKGHLSVYYDIMGEKLVVWVMKQYGVKESWVKFMVIPCSETQIYENRIPWFELVCMSGNGRLMFTANNSPTIISAVYDSKKDSLEYPNIQSDKDWGSVVFYIESLISPCF